MARKAYGVHAFRSIKKDRIMSYFDNIRTFVRVYELGSMSAAGRDLRISPAVTSSRISQLEERLGVRLFQRTTRSLSPTEQGKSFYRGATEILEAVESAEAQIVNVTEHLKGALYCRLQKQVHGEEVYLDSLLAWFDVAKRSLDLVVILPFRRWAFQN